MIALESEFAAAIAITSPAFPAFLQRPGIAEAMLEFG